MKVLWIGNYENPEDLSAMIKKGYKSSSSQISQKNLISGIEEKLGYNIDIITGSVVPHYPKYTDLILKRRIWRSVNNAYRITCGYLNVKYINRLFCKIAMCKESKLYANKGLISDNSIVLAYSMRTPVMSAAVKLKEYNKNIKVILIITDLPEFMDLNPTLTKRLLKKIDRFNQMRLLSKFDGFIVYAEKMVSYFSIKKPYIVMEGSIDKDELKKDNTSFRTKCDSVPVMYSGNLSLKYGIKELLEAFEYIDDKKIELWLTGDGDAVSLIKDYEKKDSRIKYFGFFETREDLLRYQNNARMFISMRLPSETASAYCFPSKIFEFLATGKPTLSFEIEGIPKDYWDYLYKINEVTPKSIAKTILDIASLDSEFLQKRGAKQIAFMETKSNVAQAQNIIRFIESL